MTTTNVFYPHVVRASLISDASELFTLSLLDDIQPSHNYSDVISFASGQVGPQFAGSHMAAPDIRFTTPQLGTVLPVTIAGEYGIVRDLSLHNVDLWYRSGANLGARLSNASLAHLRMRAAANTTLVLESISADEGQIATGRCRLAHVYNVQTGTDPLVPTAGVALPNGLGTGGVIYTHGPVKLNGTLLTGGTYAGIDFNPEYDEESSHGDGFLTYIGIRRYRPVITIRTRQTDYAATFGTRGTALSSLSMYLRAKLPSGINVADATAQHIKVTASTGAIKVRQVQGDKSMIELTIEPYQAAENSPPVTLAINQAIT
jgi:hypothetical protein